MTNLDSPAGLVRIGELSRRVGVSDHVLRAWESRYGLLTPVRSPAGYRLYSDSDEQRVHRMQFHLARGLSAAEAARAAMADARTAAAQLVEATTLGPLAGPERDALADNMRAALDAFDEPAAQAVLDRLMSEFTIATALRDVVLPYLAELGERWARGEVTIIQEHFASNVIRGRLAGLARGWGNGDGPRAVLACPPGELHDLPLLVFGIILNRQGWRVEYFGVNTPVVELVDDVRRSPPELIVVAAAAREHFATVGADLAQLAAAAPLALAGAGASRDLAESIGARLLVGDPVTAAQREHGPRV